MKIKFDRKHKKIVLFAGLIIVLFLLLKKDVISPDAVEGVWDISGQVGGKEQFLVEYVDFDYSNPAIQAIAVDIKGRTTDPFQAIKETARYVYDNVQYSSKISIAYCYEETASSVLSEGRGDCVSMSRLVTAILRAQGIPTRTVGGCLITSQRCSAMFAAYPLITAQTTNLVTGDFKKRGFLHEWVEAWTPERGWVLIEATSGQVFPTTCGSYLQYSYDRNQYDRCVITDTNFWNLCAGS